MEYGNHAMDYTKWDFRLSMYLKKKVCHLPTAKRSAVSLTSKDWYSYLFTVRPYRFLDRYLLPNEIMFPVPTL